MSPEDIKNPENKNMIDKIAEPAVCPVIGLGTSTDTRVAKVLPAVRIVNIVNTWKKKICGKLGKPINQYVMQENHTAIASINGKLTRNDATV